MSYRNSENWPERNGNKWTLELKINCTWSIKMMVVRPPWTNLKITYQSWLLFLVLVLPTLLPHPPSVYKSSWPSACQWGGGTQPLDRCVPTPHPPPGCRHLKLSTFSFPPSWPVYRLLSGEQPDPPTQSFSNICNNKSFLVLGEPTSATSATCYCIFTTQGRVLSVMNQTDNPEIPPGRVSPGNQRPKNWERQPPDLSILRPELH